MSKADELRLLREAIKTFPDAVAIRSADGRLIACSDLYAGLNPSMRGDSAEYQSADGRWLRRTLRTLDGGGSVELIADITELRRAEQAARFLAYHDTLTGLPNRRLLDDRLRQAIRLAQRRDRMVATLLVRLDDFRQLNDTLGHGAGDAVLREVAQRLAACVRKADTLARAGADEFAVVVCDLKDKADCRVVAEKLQQALQNRAVVIFTERQDELVATAKVGVSDTLLGRLRVPRSFLAQLDRPFDPRRRQIPEEAAAALARVETVLIVPAGPRAFIAAAAKLSGGELDVEDVDFLRSAADQVENALDRIRMQVEEADFAQARAIQQTLLPREMPRVAKLDLSGTWQPARTMGGDYYDLLKLGEHELAVCIGDVAGKGMPAALLMSGLQAAVRASASNSPRDLCERVRRVVVSTLSGGRFVTFFYATVDTAAMRLRWCNAGHNAPILARADGTVVRLTEGGPAFTRLFRESGYEEREIALMPGDRLVLFTDGVSEATDAGGELFGEERIEELVADSRDLAAHELQRTIVDAAASFSGGELEDDLTLVVVCVDEEIENKLAVVV